jgi:hypothetical protein
VVSVRASRNLLIDGNNMPQTSTMPSWYVPLPHRDGPSTEQIAELGRRLGVPIEFDASGWISDSIEIRIAVAVTDHTITPCSARVSRESPVDELAAQGGVTARCVLYNEAVRALRELRTAYDNYLAHANLRTDDAMRLTSAHDSLAGLEYVIHRRQRERMGSRVVTLRVLDAEIEFLKSWHTTSRRLFASVQGAYPDAADPAGDRVGGIYEDEEKSRW